MVQQFSPQYSAGSYSPEFPRLDLAQFGEIAVLFNPCSKRAAERDPALFNLQAAQSLHGLAVHEQETAPTVEQNIELLKTVGKDAIIGLWSGDGGASKVMQAAQRLGLPNPFLVLPGGTKNDIARMAAGKRWLADPAKLVLEGRVAETNPIDIRVSNGGEEQWLQAIAYQSFGVTGDVTHTVNTPEYRDYVKETRQKRLGEARIWAGERIIANNAFMHAKRFTTNHRGVLEPAIDVVIANGGRMAGGSIRPRVDFFLQEARFITVASRLKGLPKVAGMMFHAGVGEAFGPLTTPVMHVSGAEQIRMQIDGDEVAMPAEASFSWDIAAKGLRIITSRRI